MPPQVQLSCQVPEAWMEAIAQYAQAEGIAQSEVLKIAIAHFLDLHDPHDWSSHFARLESQMAKLAKQVMVLHRRLRAVETDTTAPLLPGSANKPSLPTTRSVPATAPRAELIDMLEGELVHAEPENASPRSPRLLGTSASTAAVEEFSAQLLDTPRKRFGAVRLEELCRLNRINPIAIEAKARSVGLSLPEAIELETGWKYDPLTKTYAPPL